MDITLYISRFLYRIRYQIIFGSLIVTGLVIYFTQFMPKTYTVNTSIYTGIASSSGLNSEDKPTWLELNSTFDNLINLTKAKGTLEKVSVRLFALNMIHGDPLVDNMYIQAENFRKLQKMVPSHVEKLIDKNSLEKTIQNLNEYREDEPKNFLFTLFNGPTPFYSYEALKNVTVKRIGSSDVIDISFRSSDPGIAMHTVRLINEELTNVYDQIRYKTANDVIDYYEEQLDTLHGDLNKLEDALTTYNTEHGVINYSEQTKAIAMSYRDYEDRYEQVMREYESSSSLIEQLEKRMDTRSKLLKTKEEFMKVLNDISSINGKITEIEIFNSKDVKNTDKRLDQYKEDLRKAEQKIATLSSKMDEYQLSKEGVAIESMVNEWLAAMIQNAKAKAQLKVLDDRKKTYLEQYKTFSPIGTQLNRKEREIRVTEQSYLGTLQALNQAKLAQKNIQLTSATLTPIAAPTFPLNSDRSKRSLLILAAFFGSIIFIVGLNLIIELLDRTLRDAERTKRITGVPVLGAFTGNTQLRYRGFIKACNRTSAAYVCNRLNQYLHPSKTMYVNLLSMEEGEGKSFVASYLLEQWNDLGLKVKYLKAGRDFSVDVLYLHATDLESFFHSDDKKCYDIILVEHLAIQKSTLSSALLRKATVNLLITNACRVWKNSDVELVKYLKEITVFTPFFIYLNNATREVVEDFTGQLPPYRASQTFMKRMVYMGFTAKSSAVK